MNDVHRQDRRLFVREMMNAGRIILLLFTYFFLFVVSRGSDSFRELPFLWRVLVCAIPLSVLALSSWNASIKKRFLNKRFEALWNGCLDRLSRFEDVLSKMKREQIADLHEMPKTIRRVGEGLYFALRRADMIAHEVQKTEKDIYSQPPTWQSPSHDAQAKELYRIADKNIAEYRQQFAGVMAGVHRAEAQCAVYMTTLDSLRMKMLGYRLVGKSTEMNSHDFLEALGEAKLQLHAIDQALDELDFTQMPKMIAAIPPQPENLQQGN